MSINKYINLKRIEFVITNACTSKCRHCLVAGSKDFENPAIKKDEAVSIISELADIYEVDSVMSFGGEPLLFPDIVCAICKKAKIR